MNDYKDLNDYELIYMVEENNELAKELLYKKYRPIINKYASQYIKTGRALGLELEDFIQEGYYGIFCALKTYNPKKGAMFYTYANMCIKSKMYNLLIKHSGEKNRVLNESLSYNICIDSDEDSEFLELLNDDKAILPEVEFEKNEYLDKLRNIIYDLPIKKASILELYYNGFTYKEIAKLLNISHRQVPQIMSKIKSKINNNIDQLS